MDVIQFQEKLKEICALGEKNGKRLTGLQIRDFFQNMELDRNQLLKVVQFLSSRGIAIEGAETADGDSASEEEKQKVPLSPEEEAYLKEYLSGLKECGEEPETLFHALARGEAQARERLTEKYLPVAAQLAVEMNCSEIALADLIQEANLCLLLALSLAEEEARNDTWMREKIRSGIAAAVEAQTQQKYADDRLVEKVQKLETAVKELTEDDEELKFSVDELAVLLDMDVEEIRDVLRLTGDDK